MFSTLQGIYRFLPALLFAFITTNSLAEVSIPKECVGKSFESTYYLVGVSDVAVVGSFFREMVVDEFGSVENTVGHRYRVETYFDFRGLDLLKKNGVNLRLNYMGQFSGDMKHHSVGFKVTVPF